MENKSEIEMLQANELSCNVAKISEGDQLVCGDVVISIGTMLKQLPDVNEECNIYRVPKQLREMNPNAYEPQLISIGPFHQNKDLIATKQYKLRALINFLRRINDAMEYSLEEDFVNTTSLEDLLKTGSLKFLVEKAHGWVKEARNFYEEPITMKDHEFLIMMLVDACFIVEIFIHEYNRNCDPDDDKFGDKDNVDFSLLYQKITLEIFYDLVKLENQVPFFLLQNLFDLIVEDENRSPMSFVRFIYPALSFGLINTYEICSNVRTEIRPKHLVDFLTSYFLPLHPDKNEKSSEEGRLIAPSVTELCEAGVTIKINEGKVKNVMNITFKNGVLEIPPLYIYDGFELMLRNMVAFEQFPAGNQNMYVTQYVMFMDDLISTEKDVRLLVKAGVIINQIGGSDKEVSDLFNNICKFVTYSNYSHFDHISKALREHCNRRWNKAKASLKHNYFNTPWAAISFSAATLLILLTLLQTIFSAISAFPS